jgi:hypothetical protein
LLEGSSRTSTSFEGFLEVIDVKKILSRLRLGLGWLVALSMLVILAACSPEGTGTIKIENPEAVRAKVEGVVAQPKDAKQAKALELEKEAAKKHPKLR